MKRIIAIIVSLSICLSMLAACDNPNLDKNAYELYQNMTKAMAEVKSIDMDMSMTMSITADELNESMSISGNMKQVTLSETNIEMATNLQTSMSGITLSMNLYYKEGTAYIDIMGQKIKSPMSIDEAMSQTVEMDVVDFPENAIKDFKISSVNNNTRIELTLNGESVSDIMDQAMSIVEETGLSIDDMEVNIGDILFDVIIDSKNMLKSYHVIYEMTMTYMDETASIKMDMTLTVNSYNNVTITFPTDLSTYVG